VGVARPTCLELATPIFFIVPSAKETGSTQKNGVKNTYQSKSVHHYLADFFFFLFSRECTAFFFLAADMRDTVVFSSGALVGGLQNLQSSIPAATLANQG
jgi:hypothetical protein